MDIISHLLGILQEECGEVAKECSKAKRFGLDDRNPNLPKDGTSQERIACELDDLRGTIAELEACGIHFPSDPARITAKQEKIRNMLRYSKERGQVI